MITNLNQMLYNCTKCKQKERAQGPQIQKTRAFGALFWFGFMDWEVGPQVRTFGARRIAAFYNLSYNLIGFVEKCYTIAIQVYKYNLCRTCQEHNFIFRKTKTSQRGSRQKFSSWGEFQWIHFFLFANKTNIAGSDWEPEQSLPRSVLNHQPSLFFIRL